MLNIKIAVIADIHSNLPALNTVLDHINHQGVDYILHLGDLIGIGPYIVDCLNLVMERRDIISIKGNHDEKFSQNKFQEKGTFFSIEQNKWINSCLTKEHKTFLQLLPESIKYRFGEFSFYATHFPKIKEGMQKTRNFSNSDIATVFGDQMDDVILFGHTHEQTHLKEKSLYINPGSVGCDKTLKACYAIIYIKNSINVELFSLNYDIAAVKRELEDKKAPDRQFIIRGFYSSLGGK